MAARACVGMFAFNLEFVSAGAFLMRSGARTGMSLTISGSMGCNALPVRARLGNYWCVGGALRCPYGQRLSTHGLCVVLFDCLYGSPSLISSFGVSNNHQCPTNIIAFIHPTSRPPASEAPASKAFSLQPGSRFQSVSIQQQPQTPDVHVPEP